MQIGIVTNKGTHKTMVRHLASKAALETDAPKDNQGEGSSFSPTDLLALSLASCMFTLMVIKTKEAGILFLGGEAFVQKLMRSNPRRVGVVRVEFELYGAYRDSDKAIIEQAALNCPVAKSLSPEIAQEITFTYVN